MAQWLGLRAGTAGSVGSISGWGTGIPRAMPQGTPQKKSKQIKDTFRSIFFLNAQLATVFTTE